MQKILFILILTMMSLAALAQKVKTVEGEYTVHATETTTPAAAKRAALEQAMIKAIGDEFGYNVSQTNLTRISNSNDQHESKFLSLGSSDVKGEWIETIGKPDYDTRYEGDMLVVTCRVKGKAREIISSKIDFETKVLRNGVEDRFEDGDFRSGDELYLSLQSPVRGYLAVYLVDDDERVQCLLPYQNNQDGIYQVEANRRYLLFSRNEAPQDIADEYVMTAEHSLEHNQMYVIFSPNQFIKAVDSKSERVAQQLGEDIGGFPRELSYEDFHKWLSKCRRSDKDMALKKIIITIKK